MSTSDLRPLLSGGDRRSIARSNEALIRVRVQPALVAQLVALTDDDDWLVSLRALDVLEKLAHERPEWIEPYKGIFIGPLADSDKWEVRLQIVRALPLFDWTAAELRRVERILLRDLKHPRKFVRLWALDSLAMLAAETAPALLPLVRERLSGFARSGSPALAARARRIREWLGAAAH